MAKLTLVRGCPGSGKSTWAKKYAAEIGAEHYEPDEFFVNSDGVYVFDRNKLGRYHELNRIRTSKALTEGRDVVVSNTLTTRKEINEYVNIAKRVGCTVEVFRSNADFGNVHGVPPETLAAMRGRMADYEGETLINEKAA